MPCCQPKKRKKKGERVCLRINIRLVGRLGRDLGDARPVVALLPNQTKTNQTAHAAHMLSFVPLSFFPNNLPHQITKQLPKKSTKISKKKKSGKWDFRLTNKKKKNWSSHASKFAVEQRKFPNFHKGSYFFGRIQKGCFHFPQFIKFCCVNNSGIVEGGDRGDGSKRWSLDFNFLYQKEIQKTQMFVF